MIVTLSFSKASFQNVLCPNVKEKPAFSNFSGMESV